MTASIMERSSRNEPDILTFREVLLGAVGIGIISSLGGIRSSVAVRFRGGI